MTRPAALYRQTILMGLAGLCALTALAVVLVGQDLRAVAFTIASYALCAGLFFRLLHRSYPHDRLGLCNHITFLRLLLTLALLAPLVGNADEWRVLMFAATALALDGLDGWFARREGLVSDFGARFDMEVDATLGLVLTLNVWAAGTLGAGVLVLGLPRYIFVAASFIWPWMARPLPESRARKTACAVQIGALIVLLLPWVSPSLALLVFFLAASLLLWSFGRDILWLYHTRSQAIAPT